MDTPLFRSRPDAFSLLPATSVRRKPINEFVYLSEGLSNAFLVVTREGRVVINTGMGFEAPIHKQWFDSIDRGPVRYIVLTQGHVDHVGGVELFREPGSEVVAHANNGLQQAYDARLAAFRARRSQFAFAEAFARMQRPGAGGAPPLQARPRPTLAIADRGAFELGGLRFELIACDGAETEDSLLVWLPQHRICFTGNVMGALFGHFPNLVTIRGDRYRDPLKYVAALDRLLALDAEMLCVGHFDPVLGRDLIRRELERMKGAVLFVHDAVVAAMNAGGDVFGAMREIELPAELAVGEGYGKLSWSARAIWEQYQGWFHGRATSELYALAPDAVAPELVALAGGAGAVAEASARRLASSPVAALQLAEAALAAEPAHRGALAAALAAHRALLARSVNFWETRWLEAEIRKLETKLGDPA